MRIASGRVALLSVVSGGMTSGCTMGPESPAMDSAAAASLAGLRLEVPCADLLNGDTETFPMDYGVTIPIRAGATVTMGAYDSNDVAIANHERHVVGGVAPAPAPFDGQFFQLDVESVQARR